ncbi:MAG: DUF4091 domain-containing protein [Clostridia bacterium]|nr:DUF4091 domain-containing protein [Clostridia bacterium]
MQYTVVSSAEFTYPDLFDYPSASSAVDAFSARGTYAAWQVLLRGLDSPEADVRFEGLPEGVTPEIYTLVPVQVERNQGIPDDGRKPHWPERVAPYWLYDCFRPFDGTLEVTEGQGGLYFALKCDRGMTPGVYHPTLTVNGTPIPVTLEVYAATLPEETLKIIVGYSRAPLEKFHHLTPGTPEYDALDRKYLAALRRLHQNMMYVGGVGAEEVEPNRWKFDFSGLIHMIETYEAAGMKYFNLPSVGWRKSWSASTILLRGSIPSMSYEGYCYLTQYLPALRDVLVEHGWLERCVMGVADEPNDANCTEFRALCGLIHKIVPEIRLCDAMSYGNLHGALDVWVPLNAEYDRHRAEIETFRQNGAEIWHYVCCGPREYGYINRFMDYPLLSTRYLHWGNYKYDLTGFLHWAANCYQPGQDPFTLNCPEHHNTDAVCFLPAGDTHILYPGKGEPWISARLEAERESAEEYEMLKKLAETNKPLADEICESVFRSFRDVEYDVAKFTAAKRRLLAALS